MCHVFPQSQGTPAYDADGNVNGDGFHIYSYDVEWRNTQIDSGAVVLTYDALGRVSQTTNPSRQNPADGLGYATTYQYDPLGRTTSVTTHDGAIASTAYAGNQTTTADAAGHKRQYTSDVFGRLTNVIEDPGGLNYTTAYAYDVLGDLTGVSQGAESRSFIYDSLQRLTQAVNPESGTIGYTYDSVGNLLTRKDNRGIVTNYTYDALNRVTRRSYSSGTLPATYGYDNPVVPNGQGRLARVVNGNSITNYGSYDAAGNILSSEQTTLAHKYSFAYGYNLAGAPTSETFPSGRVLTTTHDGANRPSSLSGTLSGQVTGYVPAVLYAPHGGLTEYRYGNNLDRTNVYNARLQVAALWDAIDDSSSQFLFIENPINWGTTANNGDLLGMTLYAGGPAPSASLTVVAQSQLRQRQPPDLRQR